VTALAAEAQMYAPDAYRTAQEAVSALDAELAAQEGRFALTRSYDRVGELADSVEAAAGQVSQAITAGKERMRSDASAAIADARRALTSAQESVGAIPDGNVPDGQGETWQTDLAGVTASLTEAESLLAGDQFAEARSRAQTAQQTATGVATAAGNVQVELEAAREEAVARAARGDVTIPRAVSVDGQRLAAGTYSLRVAPAGGGAGAADRVIEFVNNGTVAARGLAVVVPDSEIREIAESAPPRNAARVDQLRGGEYVRVWLNREGVNYLVHMPGA